VSIKLIPSVNCKYYVIKPRESIKILENVKKLEIKILKNVQLHILKNLSLKIFILCKMALFVFKGNLYDKKNNFREDRLL